jgi:bifunctional non-homologous end joining protein LigD
MIRAAMPSHIEPMLATLVDAPFDDDEWLFEIKWDGYRAIAFIESSSVRLVSRNQNDLTSQYSELRELPEHVAAKKAILDGEIVALDEQGRPSFSLMQQRTGMMGGGKHVGPRRDVPIAYYCFDLLYLDGYSLLRVDLEERKRLLKEILSGSALVRYSEHFIAQGSALYKAAEQQGLEGIVAKRRKSCYVQKRSREWLKMKITRHQECVVGGYTEPKGSREYFGSLVLGLYDEKGRLIPVGQVGSGFTEQSEADMWRKLQKLKTDKSPFYFPPETDRRVHYIKPELVVEAKFTEWTHGRADATVPKDAPFGREIKMRAPVYLGLRMDKEPRDCKFEIARSAIREAAKAKDEPVVA